MSGTVDQIQSQQIAALINAVAALQAAGQASGGATVQLQAQVAALQADVDDIKQQLIDGPPGFGEWPVSGLQDAFEALNNSIADIIGQPVPTPPPAPPPVHPPPAPPPPAPPPVVPPPVTPPDVPPAPPPVTPPVTPPVPPPVTPPDVPPAPPPVTPPVTPPVPPPVPPPVVPPVVPPPNPPNPPPPPPPPPNPATAGPGTNFIVGDATDTTLTFQIEAPGPNMNQYTVQFRRTIDFTWFNLSFVASEAVVTRQLQNLQPNTLYSVRMSANGSAFTYIVINSTTGSSGDSPDGSFVQLPGHRFTGQGGHVWRFVTSSENPMQIAVDDVPDTTTSRVIGMVYSGGKVYHQNRDLNWYSKTLPSDTWTQTSDPRMDVPAITPAGATTITENAAFPYAVMCYGYNIPFVPQVTFIFWGKDWETNAVRPEDIMARIRNVYPSNYFRGLSEYFCNGNPEIVNAFVQLAPNPSFAGLDGDAGIAKLQDFTRAMIDGGALPMPVSNDVLYLFLTPNTSGNTTGTRGFHCSVTHRGVQIPIGIISDFNDIDITTYVTIHETVEAMTDRDANMITPNGIHLLYTWGGPIEGSSLTTFVGGEMEDYLSQTFQRVNGTMVGGYWSNRSSKLGFTT